MPQSKRYTDLRRLIDPKKLYSLEDALELVKKTATTKFDSTVELHANLGIDISKSDQQIRCTMFLPHVIGKTKRVVAFVPADKAQEAQAAGAEIVGGEELIDQIKQTQKIEFDVAIATPEMMPKLAKIAKLLGPKGLMPNPKTETVGQNVTKMIEELKRGKVTIKTDSTGNVHQAIGKVSHETSALLENVEAVIAALKKAKPASAKGVYIKNVVLTSTMSPSVRVEVPA